MELYRTSSCPSNFICTEEGVVTVRHLLNGNVLAARTFISIFVALGTSARPALRSPVQPTPLPVPGATPPDEVTLTSDHVVNFLQLAVRTCQRAVGGDSKAAREAWVKLNVWYVSKGGYLTNPEVRKVTYLDLKSLLDN